MKVAYLLGSLNTGGKEKLLLDVVENASLHNLDCVLIYRKKGQLEQSFRNTKISCFKLKPKFILDIFYFIRLRKIVKKEKVEIIHAQLGIDAIYARTACLFTGIKIVITTHGFAGSYSKTVRVLNFLAYYLVHLRIWVSKSQFLWYQGKYNFLKENKNSVVHNGISFSKFDVALATKFKKNASELLFSSVGNFVAGRNQITICKVLKKISNERKNYKFLFVGEKSTLEPWRYDSCVDYCTKNKLTNVLFLGHRADVPSILRETDAFLYWSEHDTFGIGVIEALASEIPVFVNNWDVMLEVTAQGKWATISHSAEEMAEQILDFLQNPEPYIEKAKFAAKRVREKYSITVHINELKEAYQSVLK